jgi:hypothetical protein
MAERPGRGEERPSPVGRALLPGMQEAAAGELEALINFTGLAMTECEVLLFKRDMDILEDWHNNINITQENISLESNHSAICNLDTFQVDIILKVNDVKTQIINLLISRSFTTLFTATWRWRSACWGPSSTWPTSWC